MRSAASDIHLLLLSFRHAIRFGASFRAVLREMSRIGTDSIVLVAVGMAFFGAVLIEHGASQAQKIVGDISLVGAAWFEILIRDISPTIAGMLTAVRVGASLSAEVAAMKATGQIEALELCSGDKYADIAFPRIAGGMAAIPCLIIMGTVIAAISAAQCAFYFHGASPDAFLDASLTDPEDIVAFAVKTMFFSAAIPLTSVECGLTASQDGAGSVGKATTEGVVRACLAVLFLNVILSLIFFSFKKSVG